MMFAAQNPPIENEHDELVDLAAPLVVRPIRIAKTNHTAAERTLRAQRRAGC